MRIAVAQISCVLGQVGANLAKIREFTQRAAGAGAELILFPEMSDTGYAMATIRQCATPWNEGAVPQLLELARRHAIAIVCGVSEREGDCIFNTQVVIDSLGKIISKYRKTHLFTPAPVEEHTCFTAGHELGSFALRDLHFASSICYDLRFPEVYRAQQLNHGANVFLVSSAWPFPRVEHLRILATARAIESQSYLVLANRVGTDDGVTFCGSSAIIDPSGVVVSAASADREELIVNEISAEIMQLVRERMPLFAHRRPELYYAKN